MSDTRLKSLSEGLQNLGLQYINQIINEKFLNKIQIDKNNCWNWKGCKVSTGYGMTTIFKHNKLIHRFTYELLKGEIPKGQTLDHLCRNTSCCNPVHLEIVSYRENNLRSMCASSINAKKTHCQNGHLLSGKNLYIKPKSGERNCRICRTNYAKDRRK